MNGIAGSTGLYEDYGSPGTDYGGYDFSDGYDYSDYGGGIGGREGLYTEDYSPDYDYGYDSLPAGREGLYTEEPAYEEYLGLPAAREGLLTESDEATNAPVGALAALQSLFSGQGFNLRTLKALAPLLSTGFSTYQGYKQSREAEKQRKEIEERRAAREARRAIPLERLLAERQALATPSDLSSAAFRPGALQFFTPTTYRPMSHGGFVYADGGDVMGDGTSDDVPAMLSQGEFVFPSDVVSAIGNGSNEAGAQKLEQMMQQIRSQYRSAGPSELPPDVGGPEEYLEE